MKKTLGTIDYVAPEVLVGDYTEKCDLWSIGIICYELISGRSPFRADTRDGTIANILDAHLSFNETRWKRTSSQCIDFIKCLVQEDPDHRCSAEEALKLPWIKQKHEELLNTDSQHQIYKKLLKFSKVRKMKQTAMLSVALGLDDHQHIFEACKPKKAEAPEDNHNGSLSKSPSISLLKAFQSMDLNHNGIIGEEEFCVTLAEHGISDDNARELFQVLDQTKSNSITYLEFLAACINYQNLDEATLKEAFSKLDTENTGRISVVGLKRLLKRLYEEKEVQEMIDCFDITGDGCLNYDEFKAMFEDTPSNSRDTCTITLQID